MKQKIIKTIYVLILLIGVLVSLYLIINPINDDVEHAIYNTQENIENYTFTNQVKQKIHIENDNVFRILFFLNSEKEYDNFNVKLIDENNNEIFSNDIDKYQAQAMFFEFPYLEKNKIYTLFITDNDGDNIDLAIVNSDNKSYVENKKDKTMQLITYYKKTSYSYLWYPLFVFVFLFTIYPFIWGGKKDEKKDIK